MRHPFIWITLLVIAGIAMIPIVTDSASMRDEMFLIWLFVIFASSLNMSTGYPGYVNFGHIIFFGVGGYFSFYLIQTFQVHFILAALVGAVIASGVAILFGIPVLRLRGAYFALATIGLNEAFRSFFTNFEPFGGSAGMFFNAAAYNPYGGAASALRLAYFAIVIVALLTITASYLVKKSKFGLGLMAIREDQDAAQVLGIDPARYKVMAYAISAFFPALAGAIFFFKNSVIEPSQAFDLLRSIEGLVMIMLGGYGTVAGPIVGAIVYERLRSLLLTSPIFSSLHLAIAGFLLLLIVLFVTAGVVGWLRNRVPFLRRYVE
ncbi:MAG: branched-chain amino acid ABC transporter permease [Chloroflexota bacterium]|nr:branched-chain amino acid ABC transporter permease [Chloroflexota bacterium]